MDKLIEQREKTMKVKAPVDLGDFCVVTARLIYRLSCNLEKIRRRKSLYRKTLKWEKLVVRMRTVKSQLEELAQGF